MHPGRLLLVAVFLMGSSFTPVTHGPLDCFNSPSDTQDAERALAQTGCCQGNGDVCGCSAFGPVMCCNGRLSPTCMCRDGSPVTTLASSTSP